jgi:hypothetical protein
MTEREYRHNETYTIDRYLELLSTHSDHRMLPPDLFEQITDALARLIDENGGSFRITYATRLLPARPAGG